MTNQAERASIALMFRTIAAGVENRDKKDIELARNMIEHQFLREALEIIAGRRQCLDNLMSNQEIAIAALDRKP